uniref:Mitochondrial carrier protein n=1 Tax=Fibrocapsa japonica TaxID=94617 RepID=A0A7S2UUB0_9STRA|mmetsp:Transcript_10428/g.15600  ORF Transcript_10428/g.15600 Transcript_10428/m.15600 type:complete len:316 (+) Transcript_10428:124-1071(+)
MEDVVKYGTNTLGGVFGWWCIHPFSVLSVQMNLMNESNAKLQGVKKLAKPPSMWKYATESISSRGFASLYAGVGAGTARQVFYTTSRLGLFEKFSDILSEHRQVGGLERVGIGLTSGALAAVISCPAEVSLVRMSNDAALPAGERRGYKNVMDCAVRVAKEEGVTAYWRGCMPFVQRAMIVGVCQVATFQQSKDFYSRSLGIKHNGLANVFCSAFTSGLIYSLVTMPWESAKNRMAMQKPAPDGTLPYKSTFQTMRKVASTEGTLALWNGFLPYFCRCGGHTVCMFFFVSQLRKLYTSDIAMQVKKGTRQQIRDS